MSKIFRLCTWVPFSVDVAADSEDEILDEDIISALRANYGGAAELALDFIGDYEIIDELTAE